MSQDLLFILIAKAGYVATKLYFNLFKELLFLYNFMS